MSKSIRTIIATGMAAVFLAGSALPVAAQRFDRRPDWGGDRRFGGPRHEVIIRERPSYYRYRPMPRSRWYHNVRIYRPWGRPYVGYGFYYRDADALAFLGLTALSFAAFDAMSEAQQRAHEQAIVDASRAPVGEPIHWDDGSGSGEVTTVREGHTPDGRQCREFQQQVTIGGKNEEAYGTACRQPDGSWQVVDQK
jgi:hypothetical protein